MGFTELQQAIMEHDADMARLDRQPKTSIAPASPRKIAEGCVNEVLGDADTIHLVKANKVKGRCSRDALVNHVQDYIEFALGIE